MNDWSPLMEKPPLDHVRVGGIDLRAGDRVRLWPTRNADILDIAMESKIATIESIEQDYEDRTFLAVTLDDDPGRDLGEMRKIAHRFFFAANEVEPWDRSKGPVMSEPRMLIAGIGNIFFGDDAFGCEVVRQLLERSWPAGVRVKNFGIRGLDLAYELMDGWDEAILVDAAPRGDLPGTVYLLDLNRHLPSGPATLLDTHGMNPMTVLALVQSLGGTVPPLRLVGCEPLTLGSEEEPALGLSEPVQAAVKAAVSMIESLVREALANRGALANCY